MDSSICLSILLVIAVQIFHKTDACSQPVGWKTKPLETRVKEAQNVIYGSVSGIHTGMSPEQYLVEMDIRCVLKGTAAKVGPTNVTEVGTDCVDNGMRKGMSYIVFVTVLRDGVGQNRYATNDINLELAAHKATRENFDLIRKAGVDNPCNQVSYQPPNANPDGAGNPGRGNNRGQKCTGPDCPRLGADANGGGNGGNGLIGGSLWMLCALVYTVATHWNTLL